MAERRKPHRRPRPPQAGALLTPEDAAKAARTDPARLELALADALTGGDLRAAEKTSGLGRTAFQKAMRQARRDEYAQERDTARLKVINNMYGVLEDAVRGIAGKVEGAKLDDLIFIVDKLGLRLSCIEASRTSLVEELQGGSRTEGVKRTRQVIEQVHAAGDLTPTEQAALDKILGIASVPSAASHAPGGVVIEVEAKETQH